MGGCTVRLAAMADSCGGCHARYFGPEVGHAPVAQGRCAEPLAAEAGAVVDRSPDDLREVGNYVAADQNERGRPMLTNRGDDPLRLPEQQGPGVGRDRSAVEVGDDLPPTEAREQERFRVTLCGHKGCLLVGHETLYPKRFMPQDAAFIYPVGEKCGPRLHGPRRRTPRTPPRYIAASCAPSRGILHPHRRRSHCARPSQSHRCRRA